MIPHASHAVALLAQRMLTALLPEQATTFAAADVSLLGLLLQMVGQDFERAAQARVADIREMREIFAEARRLSLGETLRAQMEKAIAGDLSDLRITALDELHSQHSAALIALHARVEESEEADAARLDRLVWHYLERHAERHRYDVDF